jgi:uncharacterized protein YydD (DUF2326 family)
MINKLYSDLKSFKNLEFKSGLNILLADKSPGATDKQTRNRAGKTSMIELIDFLMGASCSESSNIRSEDLIDSKFFIDIILKNRNIIVERSGKDPKRINTTEKLNSTEQNKSLSNVEWRKFLGQLLFNLSDLDKKDIPKKYHPTFRSLFPYYIRREREGGFLSPTKNSEKQQLWDEQVAITFLLGLDWTIIQKWQFVRDREKTLKELKKAVGTGLLGDVIGSVASLRTQLAISEEKVRKLSEVTKNFKVLPEYQNYEKEAAQIKKRLSELSSENIIDNQLIETLESSLSVENPPSIKDLDSLYKEAGISLPGVALKRFEEVQLFHESIVENRKSYLSSEIEEAKVRIKIRAEETEKLSTRKSEIMGILKSHGALEEYTNLQSELSKVEAETESIRQRFFAARQLEEEKIKLEGERNKLYSQLQKNYQEERETINKVVVLFEKISSSLYGQSGSFTIEESDNGPKFDFPIQGKGSKGIDNMQIFCFDMMIMILSARRGIGPDFLIHDSHLFDGVDERQVAKAIKIGADLSKEYNFQYILTMNSDNLPEDFEEGFNIKDYILQVRLTDATNDGGLYGIRIKPPIKSSEDIEIDEV